jgi:2-polyprenyl-3-methyl-5-hydroxy-6-metoxy-1,4-benzoquinol methylase
MKSRFDIEAATWDDNPMRVNMAHKIAMAMLSALPIKQEMTAIDFGCGTGLISLALQPHFKHITGIDTSQGMVDVLNNKLHSASIDNINAMCFDITQETPVLKADVIVSSMALHHVEDIPSLLKIFTSMLNSNGYIALADLDTEPGTFHPDNTGIHHFGFDRDWLTSQLESLGFNNINISTVYNVERPDKDGKMVNYPIFLISGSIKQV